MVALLLLSLVSPIRTGRRDVRQLGRGEQLCGRQKPSSLGWATLGFVACKATGDSEAMLYGDHKGAPGIYAGDSRTS